MFRRPATRAAVAALALALAPLTRGHAQVPLAGNFPAGPFSFAFAVSSTQSLAVGISLGAQAWSFGALRAPIGNFTTPSVVSGGIFSSVGGAPGTLLAAFNGISIPLEATTPTVFNFTTTSPFTLQANTSYFFVLTGTGPNSGWADAPNGGAGLQPGIGVLAPQFRSNDPTGTWQSLGPSVFLRYEITGSPIDANVIPEPSTYVLLATGLAGLGVVARRRKA